MPPLPDDFGERVFQNIQDLWITPALKKRMEAGDLKPGIRIAAAQVVLFPDGRPPEVRVNGEVRAELVVPGASFTPGQLVYEHDVTDVSEVRLLEEELDCGHVTVLLLRTVTRLFFDFRLNRAVAQQHVDAAKQFYATAQFALNAGHMAAFVDNLFSACELAVKAFLLTNAHSTIRKRTTHNTIRARFNVIAKPGVIHSDKRRTFNALEDLRRKGRYLDGPLQVHATNAREMLEEVSDLISSVDDRKKTQT
jgi:hypothetical protein